MAAFDSGNIFELIDEMGDKIDNEYQKFTTLNIVVAGKTGVGKSTLINSVFSEKLAKTGYGDPVTEDIKKIRKEGYPLVIYDTPGLELKGEHSTQELLDDIQELIQSGMRTGDANEAIHAVWYCISTASGRIEPTEIEFLNQLSQRTSYCEVPFFVVLTKSISPEETDAMRAAIEGENLPITKVIPVLAEDYRIDAKRIVPAGGLDNLVYEMSNVLDESVQKTFASIQDVSLELKQQSARKTVRNVVAAAAVTGAAPIPGSDAPVLTAAEVAMIASITAKFGLHFKREEIVGLVTALVGTTGATGIGKTMVANVLKLIPGAGTVIGGAVSAVTAATLTAALGEAYIVILSKIAKGELKMSDLSTKKGQKAMKQEFDKQLKKSKSLVF
mgnify:FL=1